MFLPTSFWEENTFTIYANIYMQILKIFFAETCTNLDGFTYEFRHMGREMPYAVSPRNVKKSRL